LILWILQGCPRRKKINIMTTKQQLINEIEQIPEALAAQLLSFLHLLQPQTSDNPVVTETDRNIFKNIDGFLVFKSEASLPNIDWVSLVREERINDLT
jgi:hypothetical protein